MLGAREDTTAATAGCESSYKVTFNDMTSVLRNEVTVYSSIDAAKTAYTGKVPTNVSLDHPSIGDECFSDVSKSPYVQVVVFREKNVVVWVWAAYWYPESYARTVEAKIT